MKREQTPRSAFEDDLPITVADSTAADKNDNDLRPKRLTEYVGQKRVVDQIGIFIKAALQRDEPLDHTLLFGPPGLGKTTLATIIANEMNTRIITTAGPALERAGDLVSILTGLSHGDILFIDEIHRLPAVVEEILYPALEDYKVDILVGDGQTARTVTLNLEPFTLVGATTRAGMLTNPLRDRFGITARLDFYTEKELGSIVERSSNILGCEIDSDGAAEIAKRSRGTPRIANRLLRRVRDFAQVMGDGYISKDIADQGLDMLEVDPLGLDHADRRLLLTIIEKFNGGPVGIDNLASAIGESKDTIENAIEPFLIQQGYLMRTARGRTANEKLRAHFFPESPTE